jgi:Predicted nucleoside-diphosphate-sugar epimerases
MDYIAGTGTYSCLIAGATGLVGSALLAQLLNDPACHSITVLARRPLGPIELDQEARAKLRVIIADFDRMWEALDDVSVDVVFCTLGTTIRTAGSQEAFRKVDYDYPLGLAEWAGHTGARHYLVITSLGASSSSAFFYNRVKGELEEQLALLPLESVRIFRPSLLLGPRQSFRLGETIGAAVSKAVQWGMVGSLRPYRPIAGEAVAKAMRTAAKQAMMEQAIERKTEGQPAVHTYSSDRIAEMAAQTTG